MWELVSHRNLSILKLCTFSYRGKEKHRAVQERLQFSELYIEKSRMCQCEGFSHATTHILKILYCSFKQSLLGNAVTLTDNSMTIHQLSETFHRHMVEELISDLTSAVPLKRLIKIYFFLDAPSFYLGTRQMRVWIFTAAPLCCKWRHCIVLSL